MTYKIFEKSMHRWDVYSREHWLEMEKHNVQEKSY